MAVIVIIIVGKISFIESPPSTSLYFTMIFQLSISSIYYNVHFDSYYKIVWFSCVWCVGSHGHTPWNMILKSKHLFGKFLIITERAF